MTALARPFQGEAIKSADLISESDNKCCRVKIIHPVNYHRKEIIPSEYFYITSDCINGH